MNKVIVNMGNFKLDEIPLQRGTLNIGRAPDNDISLADPATSSHHAKIVTIFTSSFIQDLNSTNGTVVNGRKIVRHTLHHGDIISIGNLQLLFKSDAVVNTDTEVEKKTLMINKEDLKALMEKAANDKESGAYEHSASTVAKAENHLTGFSITIPDNLANKSGDTQDNQPADIPTLDETLPLDELRKDPARTVVVSAERPVTVTQPPASKTNEVAPEEFNNPDPDQDDGLADTELQVNPGSYEAELSEDQIQAMLMGDNHEGRSKIIAKYSIILALLVIIFVSIFMFL